MEYLQQFRQSKPYSSQLTAHSSQLTLKLRRRFPKIKRQTLSVLLIISLLLSQLTSLFVPFVYAASSPWTQTDWSGGSGQTSWSDATKFSSSSNINTSTTAGQVTLGVNVGTGADGACTISSTITLDAGSSNTCVSRANADAVNFRVTSSVSSGATSITVASTTTGLAVNDEILIINLRGTSSDNSNVGKYETKTITAISTNTLTLSAALTNAYDGTTQDIMVQRVPQYTS